MDAVCLLILGGVDEGKSDQVTAFKLDDIITKGETWEEHSVA